MTQNTPEIGENVTLEAERARIYQGLKAIYHDIQVDSSSKRLSEYRMAAEEVLIKAVELVYGPDTWKHIKVNGQPDMTIRRMDWFK